jgi:hypothetical protein
VQSAREPFGSFVEIDEEFVGRKEGPHKELVLVAEEAGGRVPLVHAETSNKATRFDHGQIGMRVGVKTDALASCNSDTWVRGSMNGPCKPRRNGGERRPAGLLVYDLTVEAAAAECVYGGPTHDLDLAGVCFSVGGSSDTVLKR